MHDSVAIEKQGVPTTVVVHDTFERAARSQSKAMGLTDLPLAVMPRPRVHWDETRKEAVLATLYTAVKAALLSQAAPESARP